MVEERHGKDIMKMIERIEWLSDEEKRIAEEIIEEQGEDAIVCLYDGYMFYESYIEDIERVYPVSDFARIMMVAFDIHVYDLYQKGYRDSKVFRRMLTAKNIDAFHMGLREYILYLQRYVK